MRKLFLFFPLSLNLTFGFDMYNKAKRLCTSIFKTIYTFKIAPYFSNKNQPQMLIYIGLQHFDKCSTSKSELC